MVHVLDCIYVRNAFDKMGWILRDELTSCAALRKGHHVMVASHAVQNSHCLVLISMIKRMRVNVRFVTTNKFLLAMFPGMAVDARDHTRNRRRGAVECMQQVLRETSNCILFFTCRPTDTYDTQMTEEMMSSSVHTLCRDYDLPLWACSMNFSEKSVNMICDPALNRLVHAREHTWTDLCIHTDFPRRAARLLNSENNLRSMGMTDGSNNRRRRLLFRSFPSSKQQANSTQQYRRIALGSIQWVVAGVVLLILALSILGVAATSMLIQQRRRGKPRIRDGDALGPLGIPPEEEAA